ncbi:ribonuclease H-like domain-containing protein [Tanacetum coccineum]
MQKVFLDSGERGGNHKKKVGSNVGAALSTLDATDGRHNDVKAATDNMASIGTTNTSNTSSGPVLNAMQHGVESIATKANFPSTYATNLSHTSSTKANHWKLEANVPNDADYNVWLPLAPVHEVNDRMKNSLYGYFIGKRLAFPIVEWFVCNNCEKYGLKKVTTVKEFFFFKFSSKEGVDSVLRDGTWIIREIPIFLNKWSPFVSLLKEELSHVPVWVKFHDVPLVAYTSDGLSFMATKIGNGYTKETIRIEYEWVPPRCSTYLLYGHSLVDCPKAAPNRVVNSMDKDKCQKSGTDDECFIEVKKKKTGGTINSLKTTPFVATSKASKLGYNKESPNNKGNGFFSLSYSFGALNVENLIIEKVETSNKATTSGMQEERQTSTPLFKKTNVFGKQILEGKLVLVDDDRKPIDKVDYAGNTGSEDKVEPIDNETTSFLGIKTNGVGYGIRSLFKQWRDAVVDDDYDPYDDMYESQDVFENIQTIYDDLDIKVLGRKKK